MAFLSAAGYLHADDRTRHRILNQFRGRRFKPDVDLVCVFNDLFLQNLIQMRIAGAHVRRPQSDGIRTLKFRIFRRHDADNRESRPVDKIVFV